VARRLQFHGWPTSAGVPGISNNKPGFNHTPYSGKAIVMSQNGPQLVASESKRETIGEDPGGEVAALRSALDEKSTVLQHLLTNLEQHKRQTARSFATAIDKVVLPALRNLRASLRADQQRQLDSAIVCLEDLAAPFFDRLQTDLITLTPTELRIANLIRQGMSVKQVAASEHVSPNTIATHRRNIRRKLGLTGNSVNLLSYLNHNRDTRGGVIAEPPEAQRAG